MRIDARQQIDMAFAVVATDAHDDDVLSMKTMGEGGVGRCVVALHPSSPSSSLPWFFPFLLCFFWVIASHPPAKQSHV